MLGLIRVGVRGAEAPLGEGCMTDKALSSCSPPGISGLVKLLEGWRWSAGVKVDVKIGVDR